MTPTEAATVASGMYLRDKSSNEIFKVLCNCGSSSPRRHTQRFVATNPELFEMVSTADLAAHLGVPYRQG